MKIALVQFNPTVGDVGENSDRMLNAISRAESAGAELVVFPELSLVGYPPRDLLWRPELIHAVEAVLEKRLAPRSQQIGILLGAPLREEGRLFNAALLYYGGKLTGRQDDSLPPYRVLDPILSAYIEENRSLEEIAARGFEPELVRKVIRMVDRAEFKRRQAAPGLKVTTKAFGTGRRFPIAWRPG